MITEKTTKVFGDHLALRLSGIEGEAAFQATIGALQREITQGFTLEVAQVLVKIIRANLVMRQRYTEDELDKALERGVTQYVILGAGLDSFRQ